MGLQVNQRTRESFSGPTFKVLTLRKRPAEYDWLWNQIYDSIDRQFDIQQVIVTEPLLNPCQDTAEWMNRVFTQPAHYYVRWDSDIILSKNAFRMAYDAVRQNECDVAGINGWKSVKRRISDREIDQITFGEPSGFCEGVDSFWIMQADKWETVQIAGCPWLDCEKWYMRTKPLHCLNLDVPYLHFRQSFGQTIFEHYNAKRQPLIFGERK